MRRCAATNIPGLAKLLNIPEHRRFKRPRDAMRVLHETEISTLYDGGNNVGMLAMYHAAQRGDRQGDGTRHRGGGCHQQLDERAQRLLHRDDRARRTSSHPHRRLGTQRRPFGGTRPALGTNPIAFGLPSSRGPVVLDMGTSAFMATELAYCARASASRFPKGWRSTPKGGRRATRRWRGWAHCCRSAAIRASGSAFIVQALGVLAGSALDPDKDDGYLFIVLKPDLLIRSRRSSNSELSALIDRIKATPRQPGFDEIRIPGERAFRSRERALRDGIEIDRVVYEQLKSLHLD